MKECRYTINKRSVTAWHLAHLIGLLSSTAQCGTPPSSRLCQRALQIFQGNYDHETESDLQWWVKHVRGSDGHPVVHPSADMVLTTDASKPGWGATDKENSTGGIWTQDERKAHINWWQFYYPCRPSSRQDRIFTSCYCSTTHALHTKHFRVLSTLALEIWEWCLTRWITIHAECTTLWQMQSRDEPSDWKVHKRVFDQLQKVWGPHNVVLFATSNCLVFSASNATRKRRQWMPWPQCWSDLKAYAFSPICSDREMPSEVGAGAGERIAVCHNQTWFWPSSSTCRSRHTHW